MVMIIFSLNVTVMVSQIIFGLDNLLLINGVVIQSILR